MTAAAKRIERARSRVNLATVHRVRAELQRQQIQRARAFLAATAEAVTRSGGEA